VPLAAGMVKTPRAHQVADVKAHAIHLLRGVNACKQPLEDVAAAAPKQAVLHQRSSQPHCILRC
jgi:hypothetical protein